MPFICITCKGGKKVLATGLIYKDCQTCHGIGYTKEKQAITNPIKEIKPKKSKKNAIDDIPVFNTDQNIVVSSIDR